MGNKNARTNRSSPSSVSGISGTYLKLGNINAAADDGFPSRHADCDTFVGKEEFVIKMLLYGCHFPHRLAYVSNANR